MNPVAAAEADPKTPSPTPLVTLIRTSASVISEHPGSMEARSIQQEKIPLNAEAREFMELPRGLFC